MSVKPVTPDINQVARTLFAGLPPRYDRLSYLLSFGQDRRWRGELVDHVAAARPRLALDVATGPAGIALQVARRTGARVVGVDLSEPMLGQGRRNVAWSGMSHQVLLALARAERLPFADGCFDAVSFSYLLRYVADPAATLAELARCLRPGGVMAGLEFFPPPDPLWHLAWRAYTSAALPVLGAATGGRDWYRVGRFLGPSIREHYRRWPLPRQLASWQAAGLTGVGWRLMSLGGGLVTWGTKSAARP